MSACRVSVLVVSYNSARWLPRMLEAMANQTYPQWRLLLLDNGSGAAERPDPSTLPSFVQFTQSEINLGFAAANNALAREAESEFIVLLNPDAFPEPQWLAELVAAADRWRHAAAIGSTQISAMDPNRYDGVGDVMHVTGMPYRALYQRRRGDALREAETFAACAAAVLYRRAEFLALGGFDESFFGYVEDMDLGYRLRLLRRATVQAPRAVVHHVGGGSSDRGSPFADYHGARNRLWCFVKNTPPLLFWPMAPAHLALSAIAATRACLRRRDFAAWRGLIAGLGRLAPAWRARRVVQAARKASTLEIAQALAWSPHLLASRGAKTWLPRVRRGWRHPRETGVQGANPAP